MQHGPRPSDRQLGPPVLAGLVVRLLFWLLVVGYAFCWFIVPKIYASWNTPGLQVPGWVIVLSACGHLFVKYGPAILLVLTTIILLRRWYLTLKAKRRRLQFHTRTVLKTVAVFAVALALLDVWLLAPYRKEQRAAAALTRLGGKVVMSDHAPRWLRFFVSKDIFNVEVATFVDLSHSHVTDADLVHFRAFRHCGQIKLADTQVSSAGLAYLRQTTRIAVGRSLDLSRTHITDVSDLFGDMSFDQPAKLNLAGNRIGRVEIPRWRRWCPLEDLDLSDTDFDDVTLALLPDGLVNLSNLDLSGTNVSDDGLLSLLRMERLMKLNLMDTKVTPAGVARLKSRWGSSGPLIILTGTRKKVAGAPKNPPPPGTSGSPGQ